MSFRAKPQKAMVIHSNMSHDTVTVTLSLSSSKSRFSKPFKRKRISEVARIGSKILFQRVSYEKPLVLHTMWCISAEATGEFWHWSLSSIHRCCFWNKQSGQPHKWEHQTTWELSENAQHPEVFNRRRSTKDPCPRWHMSTVLPTKSDLCTSFGFNGWSVFP